MSDQFNFCRDNKISPHSLERSSRAQLHTNVVNSWQSRYPDGYPLKIGGNSYTLPAESYSHIMEHSVKTYTEKPRENYSSNHTFWPAVGGSRRSDYFNVVTPDKFQRIIDNSKVTYLSEKNSYSCIINSKDKELEKYNGMSLEVRLSKRDSEKIATIFPNPSKHSEDFKKRAQKDPTIRTYDALDIYQQNGKSKQSSFIEHKTIAYKEKVNRFNRSCDRNNVINPIRKYHKIMPKGVDLISGIIDDFDSSFENYFLLLPFVCPYNQDELKQVINELAIGVYLYDTDPWFSLENQKNEGDFINEVLIIPPYKDTLVSQTLLKLDYRMKSYLNGGYFPDSSRDLWFNEWEKVPLPTILSKYQYHNFHQDPNYQSIRDRFRKSSVFNSAEKNIDHLGSQIHGVLNETASYKNLYFCSSEISIGPDIIFKDYYYQYITDYYNQTGKNYPEVEQIIEILLAAHDDVFQYLNSDQEMQREMQKLKIITYLVSLFRTFKEHNLVPVLYSDNNYTKVKSPEVLPPTLAQVYFRNPNTGQLDTKTTLSPEGGVGMNVDNHIANNTKWPIESFYHNELLNNDNINKAPIIPCIYHTSGQLFSVLNIKVEPFYAESTDGYDWMLFYDQKEARQ